MRKILDKMFCNKKWCMLIPILIAVSVYLLFIIFGSSDDKMNDILAVPVISAIWFLGVFFIVYIQVKNPICPEWFLDLFELVATIGFSLDAIISVLQFFISGFQNFNYGICMGLVTYSSICWAHSKRLND